MKSDKQYILTAGVAGSRWGRVEGILENSTLTDQSAWWTPQRGPPRTRGCPSSYRNGPRHRRFRLALLDTGNS